MPSALVVTSTRSHLDARETLRIQDVVDILIGAGWKVDLLVPRVSELLRLTLPPDVNIIRTPALAMLDNLPARPSLRRFFVGLLMSLRGTVLVSRHDYDVVHTFNDGALVMRAVGCSTLRRFSCVTDFTDPYGLIGRYRGLRAAVASHLEHSAMRRAAAVIFADDDTFLRLEKRPPAARVSYLPDPDIEILPESLTRAEFADALRHIYAYATRTKDGDLS